MTGRCGSAVVTTPSDREIRITRRFDAPAALVFEAWTTPVHVRRWWTSEAAPLVVCEIDLRVGGSWRYVSRDQDGIELGWRGTFREVEAPERLVTTELFEGNPAGEAVTTATFREVEAGTTELVIDVLHRNRVNRDRHLAAGMESGLQRSMDRLERLVTDAGFVRRERQER